MFLPLFIFFCIKSLSVGGLDLPAFIPKCSLSDPDINQCIIDKANSVMPRFAKGNAKLAIPSISPLSVAELTLNGNNLEMQLFGVYTDDLKNFKLTVAQFDLTPNSTSYYEGYVNKITLRGSNYNILSGNLLGLPAYGNGNFVITLVGVTIKFTDTLRTYEKNGELHLEIAQLRITTDIDRGYYYFENIQSPCVDNVNAYIEEHWEEFTQQLEPALSLHFNAYTTYAFDMVTNKVPLNKMFLP